MTGMMATEIMEVTRVSKRSAQNGAEFSQNYVRHSGIRRNDGTLKITM